MRFAGTEAVTLEVGGALDADAASAIGAALPWPLVLERAADGRGVVGVLALAMRGLGPAREDGTPVGPARGRLRYAEVLYRVGVVAFGAPAWLAVRCDIDRPLVRSLAAAVIRYPVHPAHIAIVDGDGAVTCEAASPSGALALRATFDGREPMPDHAAPRPTFVASRGRALEVPWAERAAKARRRARVEATVLDACRAAFGAAPALDAVGTLHWGRGHVCGRARPVR